MIIAGLLGGVIGAIVCVVTGLFLGIGLPGLAGLYVVGGSLSFVAMLAMGFFVRRLQPSGFAYTKQY